MARKQKARAPAWKARALKAEAQRDKLVMAVEAFLLRQVRGDLDIGTAMYLGQVVGECDAPRTDGSRTGAESASDTEA